MHCKGFCKPHYEQQRRGYELRPLLIMYEPGCRIEGCNRPTILKKRRLCHRHYDELKRYGYIGGPLPRECLNCEREFIPKRKRSAECCSERCCAENARLKATYGIDAGQLRKLIAQQDHKCAICRKPFANRGNIDHDHACCPGEKSCGKCIRGVLCKKCNTAIGMLDDDPDRCFMAAAYLQR